MSNDEQLARGLADVLAKLSHDPESAKLLARRAGFPVEHLPEFTTAIGFWSKITEDASNGRISLSELAGEASKQFPQNHELHKYKKEISRRYPSLLTPGTTQEATSDECSKAPEQTRTLWRLTLDIDNLSDAELYRILDVLKSISGEPSLQLVRVLKGSTILEIDAPYATAKRLQELAATGVLSEAVGYRISKSIIADETRRDKSVELRRVRSVSRPMAVGEAARIPRAQHPTAHISNDMEVLDEWEAGDRKKGYALLERHLVSLHRFFANKADPEDVEDLIQQTFLACLERHEYTVSSFKTYLFDIAANVLMHYRRPQRHHEPFDPAIHSSADVSFDLPMMVVARNEHLALLVALHKIPLYLKTVIELYYWENLDVSMIGEILELPQYTVRARLRRAREALRAELQVYAEPEATRDNLPRDLDRGVDSIRKKTR